MPPPLDRGYPPNTLRHHGTRPEWVHSLSNTDQVRRHSVKAKVIEIRRGSGIYVSAEDVERELQAWLRDNPNARIEHVTQTPMAVNRGITSYLIVTIFYRD